jgi:hypothetical protein
MHRSLDHVPIMTSSNRSLAASASCYLRLQERSSSGSFGVVISLRSSAGCPLETLQTRGRDIRLGHSIPKSDAPQVRVGQVLV